MKKSSLVFKRYTRKELTDVIRAWDADKPNVQKDLVENYLALQRVTDLQQIQIDTLKARYTKTGRMIQSIFQRRNK